MNFALRDKLSKAWLSDHRVSILACSLLAILPALGLAKENCQILSWTSSLPACPPGDNTILPANYPNAAYVVSDDSLGKGESAKEFAPSVVLEILKNSGDRIPLILMPASKESVERVKFQIRDFVRKHPEYPNRDKWLSAVKQSGDSSYTWQQDFFESFFDRSTGKPVLRRIQGYDDLNWTRPPNSSKIFDSISKSASKSCTKFGTVGPSLTKIDTELPNAYFGGNIEGLPGGLCLHGDNQSSDFAAQYCGSAANETIISTSWLRVGHVDEITGVVKNPKEKSPCDFAITIASPRLAIQLLKDNPNEKFYGFYAAGGRASDDLSNRAGADACVIVRELVQQKNSLSVPEHNEPESPQDSEQKSNSSKAAWLRQLKNIVNIPSFHLAHADPVVPSSWRGGGIVDCTKITNAQVAEALETVDRARINNTLIQLKMDEAKKTIAAKISERLPHCKVNFIELPQIFEGPDPVENRDAKSGDTLEKKFSLRDKSLTSILPNGTNALVVGNSVLSPHPQSTTFAWYMNQAYRNAGLKNVFIDTYDYAHVLHGNLHCATHSIPICQPTIATGAKGTSQ